jgi:hypothetical protein
VFVPFNCPFAGVIMTQFADVVAFQPIELGQLVSADRFNV